MMTIMNLVEESKKELEKFERTFPRKKVYLLQAAEKVWVAYILLLEKLFKYEMLSGEEVRAATRAWVYATKDKDLKRLFDLAHRLHNYHYQRKLSPDAVKSKLRKSWRLLVKEVKKYSRG